MIEEKTVSTKEKRKLPVVLAILGIVVIGLMIIISGVNKSMCANVKSMLVGKTLSGTYTYTGTLTFNGAKTYSIRDTYTIEIVDDTKCNITVHYSTDSSVSSVEDRDETIVYKDVPYTVSGGIAGITFKWDDGNDFLGLANGQEPFTVDTSKGSIVMLCKEFMAGNSLWLYER